MPDIESLITTLLKSSTEKLKETFSFDDTPEITLDIPKNTSFGDLASNVAMKIGRQIRHPAKELANIMADQMKAEIKSAPYKDIIKKIEVHAPGFINFFLKNESLYHVLDDIKKKGEDFGRNGMGGGAKLNVEFVSANPTGPLTVAHGRQAAFGDSLANILEFSGYKVEREYYINNEGRQIDLLGRSIHARYLEKIGCSSEFPQEGYKGEYITEMANKLTERYKETKRDEPLKFFSDYGCETILEQIKKDLDDFNVKFDIWFSQKELRTSGKISKAIAKLNNKALLYEHDGALWLKSSEFGDEKDRVIIKSNRELTYFAPDIAYHIDKYNRGFKRLIDIWGPDHHGYIPRIKAAVTGLDYEKGSLDTLIVQLMTLYRGKTPVRMSTRAGSFVTLREVIDEIGTDAARFFFLRRRRDSHLEFDLELAKKHSPDNPVYYIQYAHARISSILEFEKDGKKKAESGQPDLKRLKSAEELKLLSALRQFPFVVRSSAEGLEPYRLLTYLEELAKGFHSFYNKHRVVTKDEVLTVTRRLLIECIRIVIANGLRLLGVSAPAKM